MFQYDLVTRTPAENVQVKPALGIVTSGPYYTANFQDRQGETVIVFWTVNGDGQVCMVWEHTMTYAPGTAFLGTVRYITR